jgi:lipoyl(octanoyl) transferase
MRYAAAYERQVAAVEEVLARRDTPEAFIGTVLMVEHEPVITISRRPGVREHLLASPQFLQEEGVEVAETDRGGDITYHGPGQIVCYPILDLNLLNLGLHAYMRLLEQSVIDTCGDFGVSCYRDPGATGVWTHAGDEVSIAKIAACGVRVRKWISMHGLALNVGPDMRHFQLIVPCGLIGRPVTSLQIKLGDRAPAIWDVQEALARAVERNVRTALAEALLKRAAVQS